METEEVFTFTPKEERFCYEYCLCLNATKAAIRAGYSKKTARVIGSQNLLKNDDAKVIFISDAVKMLESIIQNKDPENENNQNIT